LPRPSWEAAGVVVGVLSLAGALFYSALQLRHTREATQLQLMTELNTQLNDSMARLWMHEDEVLAIQGDDTKFLSQRAIADIDRATLYMEYWAWMLRSEFVTLPDARELWGPSMACRYENVILADASPDAVAEAYPNLTDFVRSYRPCRE
jgi:hypothetical protein